MKLFNRNNKEKLLQFSIGDKVDIHNILTSEWVYTGIISSISNDVKKDSNGYYSRMATITCNDGTIRENAMGTATKVN